MRTTYLRFVAWMGALALASAMVPGAVAECGLPSRLIKPMAWQPQSRGAQPTLLRTAFDADDEGSIVGMWHVLLTAHTMNGQAIPNTVIDNSLAVWHRDGTEIMNSLRPAQDGNFCLGVWKRTGQRSYLLNHIPWGGNVFDPAAPPDAIGAPQAGVQILENVTLSADGDSYSGTFTLQAYDTSGNVYASFSGTVSAKRVTTSTPFSDLL
ncbi:MAG TPA: hypothetical protein VFJ10_00400 [Acidobacteriaceae bacterium]|nr:hypothetical protein [Acidobacteriaceae bacterium]